MSRVSAHRMQAVMPDAYVRRAARTPDQQKAARLFWNKFSSKSSMEATR